jgi:hypothetical protein
LHRRPFLDEESVVFPEVWDRPFLSKTKQKVVSFGKFSRS